MPNDIRILGWEAMGLRCPDHKISFSNDNNTYPISLIQMPNGTGKTTLLELLRAALSGDAGKWDSSFIKSMVKKTSSKEDGKFTLQLLANGRRITIVMNFDFEEGVVSYTTTAGAGITEGFAPPRELKQFLKPEFVKLFVFDGAFAESLLKHTDTNAQMAIEELFQLSVMSRLGTWVTSYWEEVEKSKSAKDQAGLTRRRNRVKLLRNRIDFLSGQQRTASSEYEKAQGELEVLNDKYKSELAKQDNLRDQVAKAESSLDLARQGMANSAKDVLIRMRNPHALSATWATDLIELKKSMDRVKLPESAAREFFDELSQETECVCGRPIDDKARATIRERASRYMGSDDVALLNSMKNDITSLIGEAPETHKSELRNHFETLENKIGIYENCLTSLNSLKQEAEKVNPDLKEVDSSIDALEEKIRTLKSDLDDYDNPSEALGDENTFGIRVLEKRLEIAEKQLAEITETLDIKQKTEIVSHIIDIAHTNAQKLVSNKICVEANKKIESLMPDNSIRIDRIERCLRLRGQEGGSVGEQLAIAYAFLATLFSSSDHTLPFVVDSPANPIDLEVRRRVAELIPNLTKQFIAFTISSERQGFLQPLESSTDIPIQHATLFRKGNQALEAKARQNTSCIETEDGILVTNRDFFCEFQLDKEDGGIDVISN